MGNTQLNHWVYWRMVKLVGATKKKKRRWFWWAICEKPKTKKNGYDLFDECKVWAITVAMAPDRVVESLHISASFISQFATSHHEQRERERQAQMQSSPHKSDKTHQLKALFRSFRIIVLNMSNERCAKTVYSSVYKNARHNILSALTAHHSAASVHTVSYSMCL